LPAARCASIRAPLLPPVLHLTFFNPVDDHYGMSRLEAAAVAVDNAANAGRPLVLEGGLD
jgi:phage portal protein BeeE